MITLDTVAEFIWLWDDRFFLQTEQGNYVWSDPDYGGDNTIRPTNKGYKEHLRTCCLDYGRSKGTHIIKSYCGQEVKIIE